MSTAFKLCAAMLACLAIDAQASTISVQVATTNPSTQASAAAYRSAVTNAMGGPGYLGKKSVALYDNVSVGSLYGWTTNFAFLSTIDFGVTAQQAGNWTFRTGVDFGYGGALYVDGVAVDFKSNDMWWGGSYGGNGSLSGAINLAAGNHVVQIYGLEGCCDGGQQAQFRAANAASYVTFAADDTLNAVPEPATIATFGLGAGALAWVRRRRKAA